MRVEERCFGVRTQMGGFSKEKRKGQTARAMATSKAKGKDSKQGKQERFGEEQQTAGDGSGKPRATGNGWNDRGTDRQERCWADETNSKDLGKGNGGEGEHEGKGGGFGYNGKQKETRERGEERVRMAPNMGAGGTPPGHVGSRRKRWRKVIKKKRF